MFREELLLEESIGLLSLAKLQSAGNWEKWVSFWYPCKTNRREIWLHLISLRKIDWNS
jgi:hypothetical protein